MIETIFGGLIVVGVAGLFRAAYLHPRSYGRLNERVSLVLGVIATMACAYGIGYMQDRQDRPLDWSNPHLAYPLLIFASCSAVQFFGMVAPFFTSGLREEEPKPEDKTE